MSTFYICEPGISFCEQPESIVAPEFVSFTFISASLAETWEIWKDVSQFLASEWPVTVKWRTIGYSLEQQKIQDIRLRREIENTLSQQGIIKKSTQTKIYSYLDITQTQDNKFEAAELTQYRNTILILRNSMPDKNILWDQLSGGDTVVTQQSILSFMTIDREALIGRFLESDTHSTAQLIAPEKHFIKIKSILENLNITEIEKTRLAEIITNF